MQTSEGQAAVRPCRWSPLPNVHRDDARNNGLTWGSYPDSLTPHHIFSACLCCSHSMKPEFVGLRTDIEDAGDKNKTSKKNGWWREEEKRITWKDLWWRERGKMRDIIPSRGWTPPMIAQKGKTHPPYVGWDGSSEETLCFYSTLLSPANRRASPGLQRICILLSDAGSSFFIIFALIMMRADYEWDNNADDVM